MRSVTTFPNGRFPLSWQLNKDHLVKKITHFVHSLFLDTLSTRLEKKTGRTPVDKVRMGIDSPYVPERMLPAPMASFHLVYKQRSFNGKKAAQTNEFVLVICLLHRPHSQVTIYPRICNVCPAVYASTVQLPQQPSIYPKSSRKVTKQRRE